MKADSKMNELMNLNNFKSCSEIDNVVPISPGIYCLRIKDINSLPEQFAKTLLSRNHNIIYIGIASKSLKKRFLEQELRAKGHGTFFRSIGAILGFKPPKGSLIDKKNKRNYKFSEPDKAKIIEWINENLTANWIKTNNDLENLEYELIHKYLPLVNLDKNPSALNSLRMLRKECEKIANMGDTNRHNISIT